MNFSIQAPAREGEVRWVKKQKQKETRHRKTKKKTKKKMKKSICPSSEEGFLAENGSKPDKAKYVEGKPAIA